MCKDYREILTVCIEMYQNEVTNRNNNNNSYQFQVKMEEINNSFDTLKDTWRPKDNESQDSVFIQKINKSVDVISFELLIDELLDELINE